MKYLKSLPFFVFLMFLLGCNNRENDYYLNVNHQKYLSREDFELLVTKNPDSAFVLLYADLQKSSARKKPELFAEKVLRLNQLSFKYYHLIHHDSLIIVATNYYDSIFTAEFSRAGKNDKKVFKIQWNRALSHYYYGRTLQKNRDFSIAMEDYIIALKILDEYFSDDVSEKKFSLQGEIMEQIGNSFYNLDLFENAKTMYDKMLSCYMKTADSSSIALSYYHLGDAYNRLSRIHGYNNTAFQMVKNGLNYVNEDNNPEQTALLYGKLGDYYRFERKRDSAIFYFEKAIALLPENHEITYDLCLHLGFVYYMKQDYETALKYILNSNKTDHFFHKKSATFGLADTYRELGDLEKTAHYSMLLRDYQKELNLLKQQGSNMIALYSEYEKNLTKKTFIQKTKNTYLLCTLAMVCIIIITLLYLNRYKNKKHYKKLKDEQQEKSAIEQKLATSQNLNRTLQQVIETQQQNTISKSEQQKKQLYETQWNTFLRTDIYETILNRCPEKHKFTVNTVDSSFHTQLSPKELHQLRETLNQTFNHCINELSKTYPKLNESDLEYCMISIFHFDEIQKAALLPRTYQGTRACRDRIRKIFETKQIGLFLQDFIKNGLI